MRSVGKVAFSWVPLHFCLHHSSLQCHCALKYVVVKSFFIRLGAYDLLPLPIQINRSLILQLDNYIFFSKVLHLSW